MRIKKTKKLLSVFLSLVMMLSLFSGKLVVQASPVAGATTVIACSDFQNPSGNNAGKTAVQGILDAIKADAITQADGFLCCGDYDYDITGNRADTESGIDAMKSTVTSAFPGVADNMVFGQGNHDTAVASTNGLSPSGANDSDAYGVFVINEDDYMWGNNDKATVERTAENLTSYLNEKIAAQYTKPIFVISHLALNYSMRT